MCGRYLMEIMRKKDWVITECCHCTIRFVISELGPKKDNSNNRSSHRIKVHLMANSLLLGGGSFLCFVFTSLLTVVKRPCPVVDLCY